MSLLPQRKKSPEEIAKLRESLGIPALPTDEEPAPPMPSPATAPPDRFTPAPLQLTKTQPVPPAPLAPPLPAPAHAHAPKPVHSFKRSDRIPLLPLEDPPSAAPDATPAEPPALVLKPGRSLRKSEPALLPAMPQGGPPADSNLPQQRHSEQELAEIRRREALALLGPAPQPKLTAAHPALIIPGYLIALAGAVPATLDWCSVVFFPRLDSAPLTAASLFAFSSLPLTVPAGCTAIALLIALFIALKKPLSRHHAAFIAVTTLFVIVFGALHYFPQLRNAT